MENAEGSDLWDELGIVLKWILEKQDGVVCIGFIWFRIWTSDELVGLSMLKRQSRVNLLYSYLLSLCRTYRRTAA
jgi:hypothetical protein